MGWGGVPPWASEKFAYRGKLREKREKRRKKGEKREKERKREGKAIFWQINLIILILDALK